MTTFDERESAFENKFAHDAQMQFKADARRNKLLGLWVAEKLGISGDAADAYARTVVIADLEEAGDEDVFRKVAGDLADKSVNISDDELRKQMKKLLAEAKAQIMAEATI